MKINLVEHNTCLNNYGVVIHDHNVQANMGCLKPAVGTLQKVNIYRDTAECYLSTLWGYQILISSKNI